MIIFESLLTSEISMNLITPEGLSNAGIHYFVPTTIIEPCLCMVSVPQIAMFSRAVELHKITIIPKAKVKGPETFKCYEAARARSADRSR